MSRRAALLVALVSAAPLGSGCMVESQCLADYDCTSPERCDVRTGSCSLECRENHDCWPAADVDNGKRCLQNQCEFRFDERVPALSFCEKVINPASSRLGGEFCLSELKGKVVLIYFGYLT